MLILLRTHMEDYIAHHRESFAIFTNIKHYVCYHTNKQLT